MKEEVQSPRCSPPTKEAGASKESTIGIYGKVSEDTAQKAAAGAERPLRAPTTRRHRKHRRGGTASP